MARMRTKCNGGPCSVGSGRGIHTMEDEMFHYLSCQAR